MSQLDPYAAGPREAKLRIPSCAGLADIVGILHRADEGAPTQGRPIALVSDPDWDVCDPTREGSH